LPFPHSFLSHPLPFSSFLEAQNYFLIPSGSSVQIHRLILVKFTQQCSRSTAAACE
jgi:hypothetical protein